MSPWNLCFTDRYQLLLSTIELENSVAYFHVIIPTIVIQLD